MNLPHQNPTTTTAWKDLMRHAERLESTTIRQLHEQDPALVSALVTSTPFGDVRFDFQQLDAEVLRSLEALAEQCHLTEAKQAMFAGKLINETEQRPALHIALRTKTCNPVIHGQPIQDLIYATQEQMRSFSDGIRQGKITGESGKAFTDIIHLGIGGSDLGPRSIVDALRYQQNPSINVYFLSNVDAHAFTKITKNLDPETTLVIIASKTFTTQETLLNAQLVKTWLEEKIKDSASHLVALTSDRDRALAFGIKKTHVFDLWDWVGGRYSVWSAIGLTIAITYGYEVFEQFLAGASQADDDFFHHDSNAATVLALMSLWNTQFLNQDTEAAIAYDERLSLFPDYLQQLRMESNGKSIDRDGKHVNYPTNPLLVTGIGTDAQHAFFQQFHQGTNKTAFEFYAIAKPNHTYLEQHKVLLANAHAQREALAFGDDASKEAFRIVPGNHPSCLWMINKLTPQSLGYLYATQEHRTFVQGHILNINSFDQFGVELGKQIANRLQKEK